MKRKQAPSLYGEDETARRLAEWTGKPMKRNKIYSLGEAAEQLGITQQTLRIQAKAGKIKARKIGTVWVVDEPAIEAYRATSLGRPGRRSSSDQ